MSALCRLISIIFLTAITSGCIIVAGDHDYDNNWKKNQRKNNSIINHLKLQTSRNDIIAQLGEPSFSDAFLQSEDEYRVLYYRTQHKHSDGNTTKDETTPLIFKNDQLIGWGLEVLSSISSEKLHIN